MTFSYIIFHSESLQSLEGLKKRCFYKKKARSICSRFLLLSQLIKMCIRDSLTAKIAVCAFHNISHLISAHAVPVDSQTFPSTCCFRRAAGLRRCRFPVPLLSTGTGWIIHKGILPPKIKRSALKCVILQLLILGEQKTHQLILYGSRLFIGFADVQGASSIIHLIASLPLYRHCLLYTSRCV